LVYGQGFATSGFTTALTCDTFQTAANKPFDILFVDNSGSMATYQAALGSLGSNIKTALDNAGADWRIGSHHNGVLHQRRYIVR
jgi:hypothetical protein